MDCAGVMQRLPSTLFLPAASDGTGMASYIVKWTHGAGPRYSWFIRAIKPNRSFYGEITLRNGIGGKQMDVAGELSESDYALFLSLATEIEEGAVDEQFEVAWDGLLAKGPVERPHVVFRYCSGNSGKYPREFAFLKIIELLAPYLHEFYSTLSAP